MGEEWHLRKGCQVGVGKTKVRAFKSQNKDGGSGIGSREVHKDSGDI